MRTYERNGIMVDQCQECRGIFLDRGELEQLLDAEHAHELRSDSGDRDRPLDRGKDEHRHGRRRSSRAGCSSICWVAATEPAVRDADVPAFPLSTPRASTVRAVPVLRICRGPGIGWLSARRAGLCGVLPADHVSVQVVGEFLQAVSGGLAALDQLGGAEKQRLDRRVAR